MGASEAPDLKSSSRFEGATKGDDGYWRDVEGIPLPVSASDLERHKYCPLSWKLAREGVSGKGDAIERGMVKHDDIHKSMLDYRQKDREARREMVVWTWWFAIVITLAVDTGAFFFADEGVIADINVQRLARYLLLLSGVWLLLAILLLVLPWRQYLGYPFGLAQPPNEEGIELSEKSLVDIGETGSGWLTGGTTEFSIILASLTIALHGISLYMAEDRSVAAFVLLVATIIWTLFAAAQLHRGISATSEAVQSREALGIDKGGILAYSDGEKDADLLLCSETGLRGRPDQIVIIDNEFIPVEQKTGKVPATPYESHRIQLLAYMHLVSKVSNNETPYGILRYGSESLHKITWDEIAKETLKNETQTIQRLMVEGGAKRNHERTGKCANCSRRHRCPESLV